MAAKPKAAEADTPATEKSGSTLAPKLVVGGFVGLIVVLETLIFFFLVPSADDVAALAESRLAERLEARFNSKNEEIMEPSKSVVEVKLGEFGLSFTPTGSDVAYRIELDLRGTVKKDEQARLQQLLTEREGRFRHRLMMDMRNATLEELRETQLGLIQRRILATSNEVFEEPILLGVVFFSYQLFED
jgi:hypothetical protein